MNGTKSESHDAGITILKIGGSVITDKNVELSARTQVIDRLADEIQRANTKNLIIIHGGGSFGHPTAQKNALKEGLKDPNQIHGFAETHHFMTVLNGLFIDSLIMHNIPAVSVTPSSFVITENGRIKNFEDVLVKMLLKTGFTPVLYGDAVLDTRLVFTILSGDQLAATLAKRLDAARVIMGVDVDGLYDADPKNQKNAKMLSHLTLKDLESLQSNLGKSNSCDVTGGMFGKIAELIPVIEQDIPVSILNASKPNHVYKALKGEHVESTRIEKE